jgi:hypothetical protein
MTHAVYGVLAAPRAGMSGSGRLPGGASNCRAGQAGGARGHRCDQGRAGVLAAGLGAGRMKARPAAAPTVANAAAACRERRHGV